MQCAKGLDEVGKVRESGTTTPEAVAIQHTNGVLDIHKSCLAIAEEKVFLAVQTYDLVHIFSWMFLWDVHLLLVIVVLMSFICADLECTLTIRLLKTLHWNATEAPIDYNHTNG